MLVVDTNKRMLADTVQGQEKREVALICAGTIAYLVNKNGDYVSATYSTERLINHFPFKTGLFNIENILANYHKDVTLNNESDINKPLEYIVRNFRRKMIIVIITDLEGIRKMSESELKKLLLLHDILLVNISDAHKCGSDVYDVVGESYLSDYFTEDKKLSKIEAEKKAQVHEYCKNKVKKLGIACVTIDETEDIEEKIIELFGKHKGEKR